MHPLYLYITTSFICFIVQAVMSARLEEGFVYDSIRIRDDSVLPPRPPIDEATPRKSKRPLNPSGGSRYLSRRRRPGRKQLDKSSLMILMGKDYTTSWMSDERPKFPLETVPSNEVNLDDIRFSQDRLINQLRAINLTAELASLEPDLLPFESLVKRWMVKRSSCPVEFTWKDLGPTYWPRWIRKGECVNRKGFCSYPTGMHCVPATTTNVQLLFWYCDQRKNRLIRNTGQDEDKAIKGENEDELARKARSPGSFDSEPSVLYKNRVPKIPQSTHIKKRKRCNWKKVPYPITVDCFCTC